MVKELLFSVRSRAGLATVACQIFCCGSLVAANSFGFGGPEVFPIDHQVFGLQAADLDGDGLQDLVLVNNLKSRITLLYNQTGKPTDRKGPLKWEPGQINKLPPDARFERKSILSELRIGGLLVADFNGDKRPDIAIYGEPKRFQLLLNKGDREWEEPQSWDLENGQASMNAIDQGDLDGDGRNDVAVLADHFTHIFRQRADGGFEDPVKIPFAGAVKGLRLIDINMDGRDDLVTLVWDDDTPIRVRFQDADGRLGQEVHLKYPKFRAFESRDLNGDGDLEWLTIAQQSGRVQVGRFSEVNRQRDLKHRPLMMMPLLRTSAANRGVLWTDLNGDGRSDLVVAESDQGLLQARLQNEAGQFEAARRFPSLTGIAQIEEGDWDGDGSPDLFVFSSEEKQVGRIKVGDKGRLPFPELFALKGSPIAMAVGRFQDTDQMTVALLIENDGKRSLQLHTAAKAAKTIALSKDFRASPSRMFFHDADQDGRRELVCLTPYEKVNLLMQAGDDKFTEVELVPPGGAIAQPSYGLADLDGDGKAELLLPQKNFVRAVVLEKRADAGTWSFRVKEQINGESRSSKVSSILPVTEGKRRQLYFLDSGRRQLSLCERNQDGVWSVRENRKLPVNDFNTLVRIGLNGPTVGVAGLNTVAWLDNKADSWQIEKVSDYETGVEQGRLLDLEVGDLNGDGSPNILFLEGGKNHLEIANFNPAGSLEFALRWKVFEQKTFRGRTGGLPEPREAVIADLTGDDRNDIAILVHDRVLLYPQE
jgi:hypothetical protein